MGQAEQSIRSGARIHSLDFMRGIAVLGMLVANIPWHVGNSMSRLHEADTTGVVAWLLQYLVFDQRFMPIFAMLFGASLLLQSTKTGMTAEFRTYYLRRMAVLMLFGVLHAYVLWPGDILITYAVAGPILLLFAGLSPARLIAIGIALKLVNLTFGEWPALYDATIHRLLFAWWVDYGDAPSTAVAAYAGSYADLFAYNAWRNQFIQWTALPYFRLWNAVGLMLIGMGFYKLGILQGEKSRDWYRRLVRLSLLVGLPLVLYGVLARIGMNETVGPYLGFTADLPLRNITFRSGCTIVSLAVLGGIHLLYPTLKARVTGPVEAVGRMALSNYVFHSVFFLILLHGFKLFPFDSLDHDEMLLLVFLVWAMQLLLSVFWLKRFSQGPLEAVWRRLGGRLSAFARA